MLSDHPFLSLSLPKAVTRQGKGREDSQGAGGPGGGVRGVEGREGEAGGGVRRAEECVKRAGHIVKDIREGSEKVVETGLADMKESEVVTLSKALMAAR